VNVKPLHLWATNLNFSKKTENFGSKELYVFVLKRTILSNDEMIVDE